MSIVDTTYPYLCIRKQNNKDMEQLNFTPAVAAEILALIEDLDLELITTSRPSDN